MLALASAPTDAASASVRAAVRGKIALGISMKIRRRKAVCHTRSSGLRRRPGLSPEARGYVNTPAMKTFNLFEGETDTVPDAAEPPGYRARSSRLGPRLGAVRLGMSIYDLPPGEAICPYHFEWTDEEWLIVIAGSPTLRTPDGESVLEPGDVACFPAGPEGAHSIRNGTEEPVRVAMISTKNEFGIAEYPDSDKVGIWAGNAHYMLRRSAHLDYWDGER